MKERLVKDSGEADERAYDAIVARLLSRPRARGVCHGTAPVCLWRGCGVTRVYLQG